MLRLLRSSGWLLVSGLSASAALAGTGDTYVNARFGYSVDFPPRIFDLKPEATNGDGREFVAKRGGANGAVWGSYVTEGIPFATTLDSLAKECRDLKSAYRVSRPKLLALSCVNRKGEVVYAKALLGDDIISVLQLRYPQAEKARWNPIVTAMAQSMTPGRDIDQSHSTG